MIVDEGKDFLVDGNVGDFFTFSLSCSKGSSALSLIPVDVRCERGGEGGEHH